ncbi:DUF488 family protein [Herbiconiux sp. CPCC 205763]|uniref:DUF488 family protein n=1 Tax=Herbiconiux aconitum TaxID=2970913 RepID=A0ABT2GVT2_9MICO|nr:DUF488 family protein [Herbiconiux aconitum]MCS5720328.1 DUF488 family protein [Herbiconiux aconitum]
MDAHDSTDSPAVPTPNGAVRVRRIYDAPSDSDGTRVLVDRLWPRGVSKERAALAEWAKDLSPSTELREWYQHIPERFDEFRSRYLAELRQPQQAAELMHLRELAAQGTVTLLTATKEPEISEAAVIAALLREPERG